MTSSQRETSRRRQALEAASDAFLERPCRLSPGEVRAIVDDSLRLLRRGFGVQIDDLTPAQLEAIEIDPPTNPKAFAELLLALVGLLVVRHFEGAAARRPS